MDSIIGALRQAIRLPFTHAGRLSIGALLSMIPGLNVITGFFVAGYLLLILKQPRREELPAWTDMLHVFVAGLIAFVISFIWFVPSIVIALLIYGSSLISEGTLDSPLGIYGVVLVMLLFAITAYFVPVGLTRFSRTGSFLESIKIHQLFKQALTKQYLLHWIVAMVIYLVVNLLVGLLNVVLNYFALVGAVGVTLLVIVVGFLSFMAAVSAFSLLGQGLRPN